jgi:DNA-binding CsgD family transcriptional regulator
MQGAGIHIMQQLTARELEVVAQLRNGTTKTAAIAAALNIRKATVDTHINNILRKLGVKRRRHIVARLEADHE